MLVDINIPNVYIVSVGRSQDESVDIYCSEICRDEIFTDKVVLKGVLNITKEFADSDKMKVELFCVPISMIQSFFYGEVIRNEDDKVEEAKGADQGIEIDKKNNKTKSKGVVKKRKSKKTAKQMADSLKKSKLRRKDNKKDIPFDDVSLPDGHEAEELFDEYSI